MPENKTLTVHDSLGRKFTIKKVTKRSVHDERKGTRPDGTDIARYKGYEKWSGHRWAWEFLRRNESFREDCKKLREANTNDISEAIIAEKYGLYTYKDYRDRYTSYPKPRFRTHSLSIIGENALGHHQTQIIENVKLRSGQVAVVFDLEFALSSGGSIKRQIQEAQSKLVKLAKLYHGVDKLPNTSRKHSSKYLTYLRALDLVWSTEKNNFKPEDIHNYLRNTLNQPMPIENNGQYIYNTLESAKNCTWDYLYIASSTLKVETRNREKVVTDKGSDIAPPVSVSP